MSKDSFLFTPTPQDGLLLPAVMRAPENVRYDDDPLDLAAAPQPSAADQDHKGWCDLASLSQPTTRADSDPPDDMTMSLNFDDGLWSL